MYYYSDHFEFRRVVMLRGMALLIGLTDCNDTCRWKMADSSFTKGVDKGCDAGALFHKIPNAPAGGPTHMIDGPGTGANFYLGTYDAQKEIMTVTSPLQTTVTGAYGWAASVSPRAICRTSGSP